LESWGFRELGIVKVHGCFGYQDDGVPEVFRFSGAAAGSTRLNDTNEIGERKLGEQGFDSLIGLCSIQISKVKLFTC
jgi:hypothetical protein